uniref:Bromodomain adjacent to zinc finger domain 2A n=1 Tax=Malurus cyaneus samueli TaxID=2593467 RepID=A0A8C5TEQ2_9PASS
SEHFPIPSPPSPFQLNAHGACPRSRGGPDKLQDTPGQPKRRGRPPTKFFKQMEQKYLTQLTEQPVPAEMQSGWWWLREPEELEAVTRALHPRGIREKALHKHLTKHREFLREVCLRATTDPIFHPRSELAAAVSQEALAQWSVPDRAYETDLGVLQWVEELEQRVLMADLQIRGWTCPSPDSTRTDLRYCEHKVEPLEDITVRSRRDGLPPRRELTNPLDLAVLRLAALEQNLERRYLKEPLWPLHEVVLEKAVLSGADELSLGPTEIAYEITPRVRTWRQTLERCRSAAQVSLCIFQLEKSIAWEKSVNRVTCLVCRRGDDDEHLLLCDGCDRGCHLYCHRPRMSEVPEGDWFCSVCVARVSQGQGEAPAPHPEGSQTLLGVLHPPEGSLSAMRARARDLTFCDEIILMEMESHEDAWPFLEPVNPRLVPGYRRVIKNPMDFGTMRARLLRGQNPPMFGVPPRLVLSLTGMSFGGLGSSWEWGFFRG